MNRNTFIATILLILIGVGIWFATRKEDETALLPVLSVSAFNQTKNADATSLAANPQDTLEYTLRAQNQSDKTIPGFVIEANIAELSDKATLIDAQGASYNSATNSLVWTPLDIDSNQSIEKKFVVRVNDVAANSNSVMRIQFNNELLVSVASPQVAGGSTNSSNSTGDSYQAPVTGPNTNLILILSSLATLAVLGLRLRQAQT